MSLPGGIVSGRLLVVCICVPSVGPINDSAIGGVGGLFTTLVNTTFGGNTRQRINYRVLDGTESGLITGDVTGTTMEIISFAAVISGHQGVPEVVAGAAAGAVSSYTPPAITPSWAGSSPTLVMPFFQWFNLAGVPTVSSYPYPNVVGYAQNQLTSSTYYGAAFCSAHSRPQAGPQTPGAFALSGACTQGGGHTIAVRG